MAKYIIMHREYRITTTVLDLYPIILGGYKGALVGTNNLRGRPACGKTSSNNDKSVTMQEPSAQLRPGNWLKHIFVVKLAFQYSSIP